MVQRVGGRLVLFTVSNKSAELSQWLCYDDTITNIVLRIFISIYFVVVVVRPLAHVK